LQEAWLRTTRSDGSAIDNVGAWFITVVGRVCVDMVRARNARREDLVDSWLPEPVVSTDDTANPEHARLLSDSVGLALLVVLDSLEPAERLAFVSTRRSSPGWRSSSSSFSRLPGRSCHE
jgi:DNA-directed RNA polymerase specialized sigma24 family protein